MPNYLVPPLLTAAVSFGAALYIFLRVPPESFLIKGIFTLVLGVFVISFLSVICYFLRSGGSGKDKRGRMGKDTIRASLWIALKLTLLPVGYLVLRFSGGYSKTALIFLLGLWLVVNLSGIVRKKGRAGGRKEKELFKRPDLSGS